MNYAFDQMGVHDAGYFENKSSDNLTKNLDFLLNKAKTASGADLKDACIGIMQRKITQVFFELGGRSTILNLYRSTLYPSKLTNPPTSKLVSIWGPEAQQIEALLEVVNQHQYHLNVPECGY